jgi:glycyl-tRNA synthetase
MAFIVKKFIHGKEYYYLRESKRVGGNVKSICLGYLGKTKKEAEKKAKEMLKKQKVEKIQMKEEKTEMVKQDISIEEMTMFCKRRGFVYPSGDIYGGLAGFWDFGHLGVELKNNIQSEWWNFHVRQREDMVGIDGSIITNPKVWEASGHVSNFLDIAVVCKKCKNKTKIDKYELGKVKCEKCGGEFEDKGEFNPMFTTQVGPVREDSITTYLRPETAQLIFTNFKYVYDNARMKLPFGIAQIGKSFRNEIAPRDFLFRAREFEQMEIEYFVNPKKKCPYEIPDVEIFVYSVDMQEKGLEPQKMKLKTAYKNKIIKTDWHAYWLGQEFLWFINLGADPDKFRIRQHLTDEKSHYALDTWDFDYKFPFGWKELQGMANRTDYDLKQHEKFSKKDLKIFDEETKEKFLPHVVCEPSQGVGRAFLVFMFDAYFYDKERGNIVLKLHPKLAPIKAAVFPIVKREDFEHLAKDIIDGLKSELNVIYDGSGSIGRRYARNDEIGTPYCITIDEQSIKKLDVTIRDRDTKKQIRVKIINLKKILQELICNKIKFDEINVK